MGNRAWNKQTVVEEIRALAAKNGCVKSTDDSSLYRAARKCFGSWNEACKAAGVKTAKEGLTSKSGKVMKSCLLYDEETKSCKGWRTLVCARKECSFYKRANRANREDYAAAVALIELNARRK